LAKPTGDAFNKIYAPQTKKVWGTTSRQVSYGHFLAWVCNYMA